MAGNAAKYASVANKRSLIPLSTCSNGAGSARAFTDLPQSGQNALMSGISAEQYEQIMRLESSYWGSWNPPNDPRSVRTVVIGVAATYNLLSS